MADEFSLTFGLGAGPAARAADEQADTLLLLPPHHAEGRSSAVNDLLLSPPTLADVVQQQQQPKKDNTTLLLLLEPSAKSHAAAISSYDSAEFSLPGSYGVLPTQLASLSFSSSCPFLAESTEADRQTMEDSSNGGTTKKKKKEKKQQQVPDSCNKEKEAVEDDDEERSSGEHNKEKEVEKEEDTSSEDEDESEDEDVKSRKKAKAQKREKKNKKEKKSSSAPVEADEKEKQVREIEDRMKRELARLEEQKERVQLELERLKSGTSAPRTCDTTTKAQDDSEDRKERKAIKKEKTKKKAEKGQKADSQQVSPRDAETATGADDQTERALSVLEDAQRVRLQTQDVVSASATVRTNAKKKKKKSKTDEKDTKKEAKAMKCDGESDEVGLATTASSGHNDKPLDAEGKSDDSESDSDDGDEHERAAKKEAKKAKKEEKEKEKKRKKEEKEREKTRRKEEKQKRRGERKARKAERKLLRKKPGGSGLMSSIDSNASIGSNDQVQQRKIESALWSEFVPFILRESHSGLFASLSTRRPDGRRRKPRRDAASDDDDNESSVESDSESDTSSLSTSSSAVSDAGDLSARGSRCGSEVPNAVPVELEQLMLGVHKFLTAVVCNAGFTGSDVFEATTGRLAGLSGLFAHPLGRNAFAVALKKLARQNTSFLLTEEGFQCILCLIEQVINAFDFKRYETDLSVARVIMNIASTFHRTLDGSTQFVQQFITAYTVWRDLMFWEKFFWDELAVAQRKGYQQLDADDQKKASDASETQASEAPTDDAASEPEEFVPFNPTLIFVLLHSTAYNMLNWDVDVRSVRKFVTRMCKKTCLSHDQRQSIMEIVDSFARSLLAPAEGTFDTVQRNASSGGSSDDVSRKLGVRKKSTIGSDSQTVEKKADASWSKEVLGHVIEELSRLTEEQQKLMTRKAEEREEEEKRQEKERKKKAAADSKKGKGGKVEAGRKHLEKAMDTFQEVQLVQRSRVIEELVSTEKSYLANLMGTVQHFLEPFRRAKVVSEGEINLLFSNIEIIVGLSQTFLTRLEERLASWKADNRAPGEQFLSDIFALVFPFMKIYATYCGNFEDVNSYLHRNKNNEKLTRFIRQCELQTNHKLDLPSLLIMPVQRIPRYRLLLQELIKCTSPHHADYRKLNSALEMIKNIADFVNEQTKGSRLHTMQKNFGPKADSIVEPWRVWIKDGHLRALAIVEGAKVQIIPMYVILFNDLLVYAKSPKEYLGKVHLQEAWVKDEQDAGEMQNILQFYSPSAAFLFAANSDEEKYEWIKALATNIDRQLQVDECREKRCSVLAEITKRKKSKGKSKSKKQNKDKESQDAGVTDPLVASAESSEAKKQKKNKKKSKAINEDLLSAFLQFHPNVIPNTAHELLTTTQRIEKTFRTLSRHFSFRNVKEAPREDEKVKNDLDLATPPTLAFSERQLPTRASRQIPPITPPKTPAPGAPLTAPARGRAASAASAPSPSSSSSSPWSSSSRADGPPPQSPRKGGGSGVEPSASLKKSSGFWGGLWSSSNQQVATTAATKGKNATSTPPTGSSSSSGSDIFRL